MRLLKRHTRALRRGSRVPRLPSAPSWRGPLLPCERPRATQGCGGGRSGGGPRATSSHISAILRLPLYCLVLVACPVAHLRPRGPSMYASSRASRASAACRTSWTSSSARSRPMRKLRKLRKLSKLSLKALPPPHSKKVHTKGGGGKKKGGGAPLPGTTEGFFVLLEKRRASGTHWVAGLITRVA